MELVPKRLKENDPNENENKVKRAVELIEKAIYELDSIKSNFDDYKHYANELREILSTDHGQAGLKKLMVPTKVFK